MIQKKIENQVSKKNRSIDIVKSTIMEPTENRRIKNLIGFIQIL